MPSPAPREPAAIGRREQILEIATHLFQKGFGATSLDQVAAEMGVTRPALYYYFRSKEELLAAIYDRAVGVLIDRASVLFDEGLPPDVLLHRLVEVHVRTMLQERPIVRVYFQEKDSLGEAASRSVKAKEVAFTKMMAKAIRAGQDQGVFRSGDPELVVNAILGMLIWVYQWYRPERHTEAAVTNVFWQLLGGGLITGKAAAGSSKRTPRASAAKDRLQDANVHRRRLARR
jgi:TetR/AcrR family transcriptional regulator, cholesterol catabolism regulator